MRLPSSLSAQHRRRTPAGPLAGAHHALALAHASRRRQHQRHGHVGGVLGQHARRVGDGDAALAGGVEIDMVDAGAERGDQLQSAGRLCDNTRLSMRSVTVGTSTSAVFIGLDELGACSAACRRH